MERLRILLVVESVPPWDRARAAGIVEMAKALRARGCSITIVLSGVGTEWAIPRFAGVLQAMESPTYVVREDLARRGLSPSDVIDGITPVRRGDLPSFLRGHSTTWWW